MCVCVMCMCTRVLCARCMYMRVYTVYIHANNFDNPTRTRERPMAADGEEREGGGGILIGDKSFLQGGGGMPIGGK